MKVKVWSFINLAYDIFSGQKPSKQEALESSPCTSCAHLETPLNVPSPCFDCEISFSNWKARKDAN